MADSKIRKSSKVQVLLLCLLAGVLLMANAFSGGVAGGQPTQSQSVPAALPLEPPPAPVPHPPAASESLPRFRFTFVINPDAPLRDLLPIPPKASAGAPRLIEDISQVPEVAFQEPLAKSPEALKLTAHTMAKINFLNRKKTDGFLEALLQERPDLLGLPMAMGDACRTKGDRTKSFTQALNTIKQARGQQSGPVSFIGPGNATTVLSGAIAAPPASTALPPPPANGTDAPTPPKAATMEVGQLLVDRSAVFFSGSTVVPSFYSCDEHRPRRL